MTKPLSMIAFAGVLGLMLQVPAAMAQDPDAQRQLVRSALEQAEAGRFDAARAASVATHPVYPWVEYADLRRRIETLPAAQGLAFLRRHDGQAVADALRAAWLPALARRQDWPTFLAAWKPTDNTTLKCAELNARQATRKVDATWVSEAQAVWRSGKSLPDTCDPVIAILDYRKGLPPALRWERVALAAAEGQPGVMRSAAQGLPREEVALVDDYAEFLGSVHMRALSWPKNALSREVAMRGLMKLAKADPDAAERQLPLFAKALGMDERQRGKVLYETALWTVASYLPDSARRLAAVPLSVYDERLHEWQVREAMARGDWTAALAALRRMPAAQREDSRWRYFEGRLAAKTGDQAAATRLLREAASSATFHGFLAADRLQLPYALCPWTPDDSAQVRARVARDPALVRAMALWNIGRGAWATREWNDALSRFDDAQRRIAVEIARDNGWFDRAVFSLGKSPEEMRLYELRFPLHHDAAIRREAARQRIDPAWVAAEIRAESIFNPKARSPADARGLMQVLPGTGAATARSLGMPWSGAASLYDPQTNIALGTAYLRQMLDKYTLPYFAIAAYNAGPAPTARWRSQRPGFEPDFWIETISYKETREYVARILAFSVIYDWRLNGKVMPVTDRILGLDGKRKGFSCPAEAAPAA